MNVALHTCTQLLIIMTSFFTQFGDLFLEDIQRTIIKTPSNPVILHNWENTQSTVSSYVTKK